MLPEQFYLKKDVSTIINNEGCCARRMFGQGLNRYRLTDTLKNMGDYKKNISHDQLIIDSKLKMSLPVWCLLNSILLVRGCYCYAALHKKTRRV